MKTEQQLLAEVVGQLDGAGIPYMVVGSLASSHHGRPRATHDADVVIDPTPGALADLVRRLEGLELYVDGDRARDALARRRQFNVIDPQSGWKLDLIVRKERPFSVEEFRRRQRAKLFGTVDVHLATPEDTVVSKLEWAARAGGSEKQLLDVAGVVAAQPGLDRTYVEHWAEALGLRELWGRVQSG